MSRFDRCIISTDAETDWDASDWYAGQSPAKRRRFESIQCWKCNEPTLYERWLRLPRHLQLLILARFVESLLAEDFAHCTQCHELHDLRFDRSSYRRCCMCPVTYCSLPAEHGYQLYCAPPYYGRGFVQAPWNALFWCNTCEADYCTACLRRMPPELDPCECNTVASPPPSPPASDDDD